MRKGCKDICCKCGNDSFIIEWTWKNDSELTNMLMCHDGYGLQFKDAVFICSKCKKRNTNKPIKFKNLKEAKK